MTSDPNAPAANAPAAETFATAEAMPVPGGVAAPAPNGATEPAAPPPPPAAPPPPPATEPATATPIAAPLVPARRRGGVAVVIGKRLLRFVFAAALLGAGVYSGYQYYLDTRPVEAPAGDPAVAGVPTPPVVAELAAAIAKDDADAIRVALNPDMFSAYTADMERFGIATIEKVVTLGTYADSSGTATELVILGRAADRSPFTINLVVIAQDGQIVKLR